MTDKFHANQDDKLEDQFEKEEVSNQQEQPDGLAGSRINGQEQFGAAEEKTEDIFQSKEETLKRKFQRWLDQRRADKAGGKEDRSNLDALLEQFLFFKKRPSETPEEKGIQGIIRSQVKKYFQQLKANALLGKEEKWERLKGFFGMLYQPAVNISFPWEAVMSHLLDERVNELQNVNYDSGIREMFLSRAFEAKDEFTCQVILLSLAMTSDFRQELMDKYYETFGQEKEIIDPDDPDNQRKIRRHLPDVHQRWFENKLRRVAMSQGKIFNVWKESRTELAKDDRTGAIVVRWKSKEEIVKGADYDGTQIGGRRGDLPSEVFGYNTYSSNEEAEAANRLLQKRHQRIRDERGALESKKRSLRAELHKQTPDESRALKKELEKVSRQIDELKELDEIISQALQFKEGYYRQGDLKSMLLDPFSEEQDEKTGLKEKDLASDIGFTKYMGAKLMSDTAITLNGEHAIPLDIAAFAHLMKFRRRREYAWITKHSLLGVRNITTGEYQPERDAYRNLSSALSRSGIDNRWVGFALASQGFYIDNYQGEDYVVAKNETGQLVAVMKWTDELNDALTESGYFDKTISLSEREADFKRRIKEATEAGRMLHGKAPSLMGGNQPLQELFNQTIDPEVGEAGDQINEELGVEKLTVKILTDLAEKKKEDESNIDWSTLLRRHKIVNQAGESRHQTTSFWTGIGEYINTLLKDLLPKEGGADERLDERVIELIQGLVSERYIDFRDHKLDEYLRSKEGQGRRKELLDGLKLKYEDIYHRATEKQDLADLIEEEKIRAILPMINQELKKSCLALALDARFQKMLGQQLTYFQQAAPSLQLDCFDIFEEKSEEGGATNLRVDFSRLFSQPREYLDNVKSKFDQLIDGCVAVKKTISELVPFDDLPKSIRNISFSAEGQEELSRRLKPFKEIFSAAGFDAQKIKDITAAQILNFISRTELIFRLLLRELEKERKEGLEK